MIFRDKRVWTLIFILVIWLAGGTFAYHFIEGWSYLDSFYFSSTTLTTVGFGDLSPTHSASKFFTALYVLSGVGIFLASLAVLSSRYIEHREKKVLSRAVEKTEDIVEKQTRQLKKKKRKKN